MLGTIAGLLASAVMVSAADSANKVSASSLYNTLPHVVDGASWKTTIILANLDDATRKYKLIFHGDDGQPRSFDLSGRGSVNVVSGEIPKGAVITLETAGTSTQLNQGWAELDGLGTDYKVGMMAIFGTTGIPGRPDFEATVPGSTSIQYDGVLPFDNSRGFVTSVAVLNPSPFADETVPITIYDESGKVLKSDAITLKAGRKIAFALPDRWAETAGKRGSLHFQGSLASWAVLGFRFNPGAAFTTVNLLEP